MTCVVCNFVCRFPFDWKNPIGYTFVSGFQYVISLDLLIGTLLAAIFLVGSVKMLVLIPKDLNYDLESINIELKPRQNRVKVAKHFVNVIKFHSDVKQLS